MRTLLILMGIIVIVSLTLGQLATGGAQSPTRPASTMPADRVQSVIQHGEDLLSNLALWEAETTYYIVTQATPFWQAVFGLLMCLRGICTLVGLYVLLTLGRVASRVSHKINGD